MILNLAIILFVLLETMNALILFLKPDFSYGNSMASFKSWTDVQKNEQGFLFAQYLVNWIANCKVIFIMLLVVILILGDERIKMIAIMVTIVSIGMYFITLHPILRKLDGMGKLNPPGYSKTLGFMIGGFMVMFTLALVLHSVIT